MATKIVIRINGRRIMRPRGDQPNPEHWAALKRAAFERVRALGRHCEHCVIATADADFQLHHLHYDTWGRETLADVAHLCVQCHDAQTDRIRRERYALGDRSVEFAEPAPAPERHKPQPLPASVVAPEAQADPARSKPSPPARITSLL